jgi:uncharacterized membrane protein
VPKTRLEAFSDGVFAVAITLLIFSVQAPHVGTGDLGVALLALAPSYASYVVSFLTIGIIWVNHHALFALIRQVDRPLSFMNLVLLMIVAFLPFPTQILGEYIAVPNNSRVAAVAYASTMTIMGLAFGLVWTYATQHHHLLTKQLDPNLARKMTPRFVIGNGIYIAAIGVAFASPYLAIAIDGLVAVYYVFNHLPTPEPEPDPEDTTGPVPT